MMKSTVFWAAAVAACAAVAGPGGVARDIVKVSDFGFAPEDSTRFLQAALDSGAKKVVVDRQASPWITKPLFCRSGQEVFFEEGVEVVAKRGEFRAKDDCLFMLNCLHDVRLVGGGKGATLRMWREDYLKPPYETAEWRHCVAIHGSCRVTLENLALRNSGGDGIYVRGCTFDKARGQAISLRKPGPYFKVEIADCTIRDCCVENPRLSEVRIDHIYGDIPAVDAVTMRNLRIFQPVEREWIALEDVGYGAHRTEDFTGDVIVTSPNGTKKMLLDAAFREWACPAFWAEGEPKRRRPDVGAAVIDRAPGRSVPLSRFSMRGDVRYVFYAAKAGQASFKGRLAKIGKKPATGAEFEVRPLGGGDAVKVQIPSGKSAKAFAVNLSSAGFYSMRARLGGHAFVLESSDVPVGIDVSERPAEIHSSVGDVWFAVRGGEPFNVMVSGAGWGERVGAELFDPSGAGVWREPSAIWWRGWRGRGATSAGLWKLRLARPEDGRLEDYRVDMTGASGVLFLTPEKHW